MNSRVHKILDELGNDSLRSKTIYKYHRINKFVYDLLINSEVWFANPYSFNDPFDCNITIDGLNTPEQIKHYFKVAHWKKKFGDTDEEIKRLIETDFADCEAFQKKINVISKQVIGNLGLSCFGETKDNLLMWAHYTEDHKGLCLEFDYGKDATFFKPLKKMRYTDKYPVYNYYNNKNNVVEQLILHKSQHWKYEMEVRLLKHKTGLYKFNPESLVGIYFGVRTPPEQVNTIKNLINQSKKYHRVKLFTASLNNTSYQINFEQLQ